MEPTLGSRIKAVRKSCNHTQQSFGGTLGVSHAHISNIESGKEKPSQTLLMLICLKYHINEEWLSNGTGDMLINKRNLALTTDGLQLLKKHTKELEPQIRELKNILDNILKIFDK